MYENEGKQFTTVLLLLQVIVDEEFDTTIQGPWMKKWQITHMNAHTDAHERAERK